MNKEDATHKLAAAWFRNEQFWMGVAASTFSTGILAVAGLVAAFATGLVDWKSLLVTVLSIVAVVFLALAIILSLRPVKDLIRAVRLRTNEASTAVSPKLAYFAAGMSAAIAALINMFLS